MNTQIEQLPLDTVDLPESWEIAERDSIPSTRTDALLTGPRNGESVSIKVRQNSDVLMTYTPSAYDATRVSNPSYLTRYGEITTAIKDLNRFFNGADAETIFDKKNS